MVLEEENQGEQGGHTLGAYISESLETVFAVAKDNRSRMTVPMTDSHLRYNTAVARVDDAAGNVALAPEDQAKSLL